MNSDKIVIGVVGNPNCGKTTLFNLLTGARQRVGNWPGVTVDRKVGSFREDGATIEVVDLPGVYSLGVVPGLESLDEKIGRDFAVSGEADLIVNIVDATNLERNLYLTAQLVEMRLPLVVALNMMDQARAQGLKVDAEVLSRRLGCPVVPISAKDGDGIAELRAVIRRAGDLRQPPTAQVTYLAGVEKAIGQVSDLIGARALPRQVDGRWLAVRLLEADDLACELAGGECRARIGAIIDEAAAELGEDLDTLIADGRFAFAHGLAQEAAHQVGELKRSTSDMIDRVVVSPWLGLPVFLAVMYLMFMFTINLGGAFIDFFDMAAQTLFVDGLGALLDAAGAPVFVKVVLANGVGGGIQVVATFIPIIGFLYLFLSALEDSGYMARAAFLMDRYMRMIGLPGKSFVPLIVGFGCNVPAIMATRTLEQQRDRTMSVMMAPFMSCGARLAVYALFAAAFFPSGGQNVVFVLYIVGILIAVATGFLLKHTLLRGETTPFVMELPPYHVPQLRSVLIAAWNRLKGFVFGAGKLIVIVVTILGFLNSWGTDASFGNEDSEKSVLSAIGRAIVPAFRPLGIHEDNWPATVGIFTGVFAKEAVVGTLDALYTSLAEPQGAAEDEPFSLAGGLAGALATIPANLADISNLLTDPLDFGQVTADHREETDGAFGAMVARFDGAAGAFAYMLFILLYFPCVAAMGAIVNEIGGRWAAFAGAWTTGIAYGVSVGFYQAATFASHPAASMVWLGGITLVLAVTVLGLRIAGRHAEPARPRLEMVPR